MYNLKKKSNLPGFKKTDTKFQTVTNTVPNMKYLELKKPLQNFKDLLNMKYVKFKKPLQNFKLFLYMKYLKFAEKELSFPP